MEQRCDKRNSNCLHFISNYNIEFKIITTKKGDYYDGHTYDCHRLVFLLEGEIIISYKDLLNRHFVSGDIFSVPQSVNTYYTAVTDAKMLVLIFNNRIESLCGRCRLSQVAKSNDEVDYDFRPLRITDTLFSFANQIEKYINMGIRCRLLHELKQKELFIIMGAEFSEKDLIEFFYPIYSGSIDFKTQIMENYHYGLEINELAKKLGMSYSPFLRKFKKEFGMSMQDWIQKQKAKHIKARITVPSVKISDIINEFDFTDTSHFVRFCRKRYECTPTELIHTVRSKKNR